MTSSRQGAGRTTKRRVGAVCAACMVALAVFAFSYHAHLSTPRAVTVVSPKDNLITTGEWSYMPGAHMGPHGLQISYRDVRIVEQDGSGGQPNPSLNLYGTHLEVPSDFALSATVAGIRGVASVQFYGAVPIVADEFRVERQSVRLGISGSHLVVEVWDGHTSQDLANQQPRVRRSFLIAPAAQYRIELTDEHGKLDLAVNGRRLGHVSDLGTFRSGEIWVGATADTARGRFVISGLHARSLDAGKTIRSVNLARFTAVAKARNGLQALASAKRPGFLVGAAMALAPLSSDKQYRNAALSNFGSLTTENALKWQFTQPQPGVYDLSEARAMVDIAKKNHLAIHGHTLVFSEALPKWVRQLSTATPQERAYVRKVMVDHVTYLVSHLPQIGSWDVVNEPIADYSDFDSQTYVYRDNVFFRAMGPDYIKVALEAAHRANPRAKLYINDYGDESDTGDRWSATYNVLKELKRSGVPLNGFGFESHVYDSQTDAIVDAHGQATTLASHIRDLAGLGLTSRISEMDVDDSSGTSWQVQQFAGVLRTCINLWPECVSFTVWGVSDRYDVWQTDSHQLQYGQDLLLDSAMRPTASYAAVRQVLGG